MMFLLLRWKQSLLTQWNNNSSDKVALERWWNHCTSFKLSGMDAAEEIGAAARILHGLQNAAEKLYKTTTVSCFSQLKHL